MKTLFTLLFICAALPGHTECHCQCVDGLPRTLCTGIEEAKSHINLCGHQSIQCPQAPRVADIKRYTTTIKGAINCRDVLLYDRSTKAYSHKVKACNTKDDPAEKK